MWNFCANCVKPTQLIFGPITSFLTNLTKFIWLKLNVLFNIQYLIYLLLLKAQIYIFIHLEAYFWTNLSFHKLRSVFFPFGPFWPKFRNFWKKFFPVFDICYIVVSLKVEKHIYMISFEKILHKSALSIIFANFWSILAKIW